MTENKRYSFNWKSGHPNFWDNHCDLADCYLTCGDVVNILNELNDENEQLKKENKKFQGKYDHLLWLYNSLGCEYDWLKDENKQLKQRNNRQYEQLSRLYNLIEQKEWRVLTDIIDNLKKSDEQLQKEWGTYGDVE